MEAKDLPTIMQCQRCDSDGSLVRTEYEEHYVQCIGCNTSTNDFCASDFTVEDEKPWHDTPILMAKRAAINDWNSLQELIRKGKMYDELKALVEATERATKSRSL